MNWQPIETAPRYGSIIAGHSDFPDSVGEVTWDKLAEAFRDYKSGELVSPTHWMPLPAIPGEHPESSDYELLEALDRSICGDRTFELLEEDGGVILIERDHQIQNTFVWLTLRHAIEQYAKTIPPDSTDEPSIPS